MDFVDEQHVALFQGGKQTRQVARLVQHGTGGYLHVYAHLVRDDVRERGFSQTGRAMEERMIQGVSAHLGGLDVYLQVRDDFPLSGEIIQFLRADNSVQFIIFAVSSAARVEFAHGRSDLFQVQI